MKKRVTRRKVNNMNPFLGPPYKIPIMNGILRKSQVKPSPNEKGKSIQSPIETMKRSVNKIFFTLSIRYTNFSE